MSDDKPPLADYLAGLFKLESSKLGGKIDVALENSEKFSLEEVIELYHQVINVTSIAKMLKENSNMKQNPHFSVQEIERLVTEKFNNFLHPEIISHLEKSNEELRNKLRNIKKANKTKTEVENQAKMFEQLRKIMSTQEFVNQYDRLLPK